eukprot:CCRYP_011840-RA/>CCRYP_011840-RA protein AED:0.04 eAED:0.04 QI:0/-1/0/1/-1/1/1/0/176
MFQQKHHPFLACLAILISIGSAPLVTSFSPRPITNNNNIIPSTHRKSTFPLHVVFQSPKSSPLEDEPWKRDPSYWDMLQQASKDPETFEKFIEESMTKKKIASTSHGATQVADGGQDENGSQLQNQKTKGKYQPIEEWDAQRKESMSAEERLQWECQRNGNRFRQNEILSHHLKSF